MLLLPANEVWGKVIFLYLSVNHSFPKGGVMMSLPFMDSITHPLDSTILTLDSTIPPWTAPSLLGQHPQTAPPPLQTVSTPIDVTGSRLLSYRKNTWLRTMCCLQIIWRENMKSQRRSWSAAIPCGEDMVQAGCD